MCSTPGFPRSPEDTSSTPCKLITRKRCNPLRVLTRSPVGHSPVVESMKAPRGKVSRRLDFGAGISMNDDEDSTSETVPEVVDERQPDESWPSPPKLRRTSATPITYNKGEAGSVVAWSRLKTVTAYTSSCPLASADKCESVLSAVRDVR